jgi:hypothetical protein
MRPPTSQDNPGRRRWLSLALVGVAGVVLLAAALWLFVAVLPQRLYPPLSNAELAGLSPADQAARREGRDKLQNDARTTLLQGLAALLVLSGAGIGAAVTLRQVRISQEQLEHARQQAQLSDERLREQTAVAQEGQITERFTRAVDQLGQPGPDRLDVRLGGIYALERIAHDSSTHRLAVFEIFTAFIRSHAPWPPHLPGQYPADATIDQMPPLQTRAPDVQAALTTIGRRPTQKDDPHLDLNRTDLREANLARANLTRAWLEEANLTRARLDGADLTEASLVHANLTEAQLDHTNLTGAHLRRANLTKAWLHGAILTEAFLGGATLTEAWLGMANLTGAPLGHANLTGVELGHANLTGAQLDHTNLTGARLGKARASSKTVWPDGWDRRRRAAAGVDEPDEEAPPAASPPT